MILASVDDKCRIPVGNPACPVSTGIRGHNCSLVPVGGPQLQALDHDFYIHGIVPSVACIIDVCQKMYQILLLEVIHLLPIKTKSLSHQMF